MSEPVALSALLIALFGILLVLVALTWRWLASHRAVLQRIGQEIWQHTARSRLAKRAQHRFPRSWNFVRARFSPREYLGLHLTVGLVLSVGAVVLFGVIVEDIADQEEIALLDGIVLNWTRQHVTQDGVAVVQAISLMGSPRAIAVITGVVALVLVVTRKRMLLAGWLSALIGGGLLDVVLKAIFRRPRPEGAGQFLSGHSWSFPSGHTMGSLIAFGMLAYLLSAFVESWRWRVVIWAGALLVVLAIGVTRLYLGVHYFTDVIAGLAGGVVWLSACISGVEISKRR